MVSNVDVFCGILRAYGLWIKTTFVKKYIYVNLKVHDDY